MRARGALVPPFLALAAFALRAEAASLPERLELPDDLRRELRTACGEDVLCQARWLAARLPARFRLERLPPPDTDRIRWVVNDPSLGPPRRLADGRLLLDLRRFGRTLWHELRALPPSAPGVVLDLRANRGGDFRRMLRLAARLLGPARAVVPVVGLDGRTQLERAEPAPIPPLRVVAVLVGPATASSAEILAALFAKAGIPVCGRRTFGKTRLEALVPVNGRWLLRATVGQVRLPGLEPEGGLRPRAPLEACLEGAAS